MADADDRRLRVDCGNRSGTVRKGSGGTREDELKRNRFLVWASTSLAGHVLLRSDIWLANGRAFYFLELRARHSDPELGNVDCRTRNCCFNNRGNSRMDHNYSSSPPVPQITTFGRGSACLKPTSVVAAQGR